MRTWALGQLGHVAAGVNPFLEEELAGLRAERTGNERLYGDVPLVVMTRGMSDEDGPDGRAFQAERRQEHAALAALSRNGRHLVASRSGHHVQLDEPVLVVGAIRQVIAAAAK